MGSRRISQQSTIVKKKNNVPAAGGSDAMDIGDRVAARDHRVAGQRSRHARLNTVEGTFNKRQRFPTQITKFEINQTFAPYNTSEFFKPEVLRAWNELLPVGMGFQSIPDPENYHDLPTPIVWPNATVFTTSMTHQLHCLYAVVAVYSGMTSGHELEEDHHWHMIHCFDYMRQAIMCSADMALEGLETTFPDHNGGSDGWDSKHVCKDPKKVRERLESVRAYDDQEIF
ncbi:unnamed protein product [Alternaria alternata]|uniref:Uncharacterized protein n=1 Tax=Alternaria tenuissima TaxID=119927 RepID=A0AB37WJB5_9PLEO|nr:hypothetical protein AA0115_g4792 [Alternaria tenuissima]RYO07270.1 hypothetical protein AA0119_g2267 [Alternaria tenuissima]RYO20088.1 hypothetical protein AA0121_g3756 [Alternaria tenuissima]